MQPDFTLYFATDRELLRGRDLITVVARALDHGVTMVQLREKNGDGAELFALAESLHALTLRYQVPLIVNDHVDIMLAVGAEGVHVGARDMPLAAVRKLAGSRLVGYSVNTRADLDLAQRAGADYVGIGPVFATPTKPDAQAPLGLDGLRALVERAQLPCVGIGGIGPANVAAVMRTGVTGVCVISAVMGAPDSGAAAASLRRRIQTARS